MTAVRTVNSEPIPGYRLLEPLGKGGYGEVWKCEAPGGLIKAIKIVAGTANHVAAENSGAEQELRSLQHVKSIRHPFLLSMERVEIVDGDLIIVTELADRSLHDLLCAYRKGGAPGIPREDLIGYLRETAEVLDLMNHDFGLQHLDVKPRNLFLVGRHVKVADFGLVNSLAEMSGAAPHTVQLGAVTPLYAAPESFLGKISQFSDQYSLAVAYCEMLTGVPPFDGKNFRQLAMQHLQTPPNLDRLPECDHATLYRALAKEPTQRFPSCTDFVNALAPAPAVSLTNIALSKASFPEMELAGNTQQPKSATAHDLDLDEMAATPQGPPAAPLYDTGPTAPGAAPPANAANTIDNYRLLECVGRLPGGELWKSQSPAGQPCTIRFLFNVELEARESEGRPVDRLRALRHPTLAKLEVVETSPRLALAYGGGDQTLGTRLKECQLAGQPGLPRSELLDHLRAVAEALDELFKNYRLQHLSLTPRQLYLVEDKVRIADFGLVELFWLPSGNQAGGLNARYAPPELFEGQITRAADQYSLALIYQELLTGMHPFRNMNPRQMASQRLRGKPDLGMLPVGDRPVILKALHGEADHRFASCAQLIAALQAAGGSKADLLLAGSPARPPAPAPRPAATPAPPVDPPGAAGSRVVGITKHDNLVPSASVSDAVRKVVESAAGRCQVREYKQIRYLIKPGDGIEHRCFARLVPSLVKLKLDGFRDQWGAERIRTAPEGTYVYHVPIRVSVMQRFLGVLPHMVVTVSCQFPEDPKVDLAEVLIRIKPQQCAERKGTELLAEYGPKMLESIRLLLQANAERRGEERLPFEQPVTIYPVSDGQAVGAPIQGKSREISLNGMSVYLPSRPPTRQVCLQFTWSSDAQPITLLAKVLRVQSCPDGRQAVGLIFLQNMVG